MKSEKELKHKIWTAVLLSLLAVLAVKIVLPLPYHNKALTDEFWANKTFNDNEYNIVIGGDSRVYRGLSPSVLEENLTTQTAINLGYSDAGFSKEYLRFLTSHFKDDSLKILILGLSPHAFLKRSNSNELLHEIQTKSSSQIFKDLYFAPFTKHFAAYDPYELMDDSSNAYLIDYQNDGFAKSDNAKGDYKLTYYIYWDIYNKEQVDANIVADFFEELKSIQKSDVKIVCYLPPTDEKMLEIETNMSGFNVDSVKNELKKLGVYWLDTDFRNYRSYDGSHLDYHSAYRLSKKMAEMIQEKILKDNQ